MTNPPLHSSNAPPRAKTGRPPSFDTNRGLTKQPYGEGSDNSRWDSRFMVYTAALICVLALLTAALIRASEPNVLALPESSDHLGELSPAAGMPEEPPLQRVEVETPNGPMVGHMARVDAPVLSPKYQGTTPQTPIDKEDRKRLLSIISNY